MRIVRGWVGGRGMHLISGSAERSKKMANLTFLDLMFAEALASGLAREAARTERPPPDNFFILPRDPDAGWRKIKEASKKENMVVCIEFTDNANDNCRTAQGIFMDLAREFENIPFVRVVIAPGATYNEMRADLGGVQYTPSILIVFYGDDSVSRAKFEGMAEIRVGISTGKIQGVIKELVSRRVKLKIAERLAEGLAERMQSRISDQERKMRDQYETKLERQVAEKEEELKKLEQEKKMKEEQEEQEKDRQRRLNNEKLRQERPQHLEELFKMDLDSATNRQLKVIMQKMGISFLGCLDRKDLKDKLMESVPELRLRQPDSQPKSSSPSSTPETRKSPASLSEIQSLRKDLDQMRIRANRAEAALEREKAISRNNSSEVISLRKEVDTLRRQNSSGAVASGGKNAKVMELETSLLETRMLYTTSLQDYEIMAVVHDSASDKDCDSLILRVRCIKPGLPNKGRLYAMKVLTSYFKEQTQTQVRRDFQNEYEVLCQLPPHENIIHMWAFFYDRPTPREMKFFKKAGKNAHLMALFILMDEHPTSMAEQLQTLADNKGPNSSKVIMWVKDLLNGLLFLEKHHVVHRDLKLSNLLLTSNGKLIISDFGKAIAMEGGFTLAYQHGLDIGGNRAHFAPELLNSRPGPRTMIDYSKQPVWAAGLLAYELAGHPSPFQSGTIDQRGYSMDELPPLKTTYCKSNPSYHQQLPAAFTTLVKSMLELEPSDRPSLQSCLDTINNM